MVNAQVAIRVTHLLLEETLVAERRSVGRADRLLVRRTLVLADATSVFWAKRFADGEIAACNVDTRIQVCGVGGAAKRRSVG